MCDVTAIIIPKEAAETLLRVCEGAVKIDTSLMQQLGVKSITRAKLAEHQANLHRVIYALNKAGIQS